MLITSVDSQVAAKSLACGLLEQRLAACVQSSAPVVSVYRWKGRIESCEEYRLSIKTTAEKLGDVITWLRGHHPYEVPELVWWPVDTSNAYAAWMQESMRKIPDQGDHH